MNDDGKLIADFSEEISNAMFRAGEGALRRAMLDAVDLARKFPTMDASRVVAMVEDSLRKEAKRVGSKEAD